MGFFDKVKDVLTTSDKERRDKAAKGAATAQDDAAQPRREAVEKQAAADEKAVVAQEGTADEQAGGAAERTEATSYRTCTVQPGDSLADIAARHGVDEREMATLNNLDNPDLIYPGQVFKVPHS